MKTPNSKPLTLAEHLSRAAKARHAKRTPEERSAYAKKMVDAREAKRLAARETKPAPHGSAAQ
jgi:uncharacterized protein YaiL (DUF2058 family)